MNWCMAPRRTARNAATIARCCEAANGRVPSTGEDTIYRANGVGFPAEYFLNPILDMGRYSGLGAELP